MALLVGVFAAYYVVGRASLRLSLVETNVTPLWPPTGIAVVALFLLGNRAWPAVAVAALAVNATVSGSPAAALAIGAGNTAAPLLAASLLRAVRFDPRLGRARDAVVLVAVALTATLVSATTGSLALVASDAVSSHEFAGAWSVWWAGDAMGILSVAPVLWTVSRLRTPLVVPWRTTVELAATLAALTVATLIAVHSDQPRLFLVLPLTGWVAWRFQQAGAAPAALVVSALAAWAASDGWGPFDEGSLLSTMLTLQAFNASVALSSFFFAAVVAQRREAADALAAAHQALEVRARQGESQLAEAQAVAHIGSWTWDLVTNRLDWSDELYRICGVDSERFSGTYEGFAALVHPDDRQRVEDAVAATLAHDRPFNVDHRIVRPDGTTRVLRAQAMVVRDAAGAPVRLVGTGQDVTEWKQAENALRESEEAFRSTFESATIGLVQASPDGRVVHANATFARLAHRPASELGGRSLFDLIHPDDAEACRRLVGHLLAGKEDSAQLESRYVRDDGTWFWAHSSLSVATDAEGRPKFVHAVVQDLTERKQAEALVQAEVERRRLEEIFLRAPAAVVLTRGPDHVIEFANPAFFATLGAPECIGVPARQAFPEVEGQGYFEVLDQVYATGEPYSATEAPVFVDRRGDGTPEEAFFSFTYQPVRDTEGRVEGIFGHGVEVTAMVRARQQVEAMALVVARLYEREHQVADTLQRSFLPDTLPQVDGAVLAARYLPGSQEADVGGDWYDAVSFPDGRLLLVIGDVEGHGVRAAAAMGQLRNALRAYAFEGALPGQALARLNRLVEDSGETRFATVLCVSVCPARQQIRYASAGHPPPLLIRPDGTTAFLTEALSPPVGVSPDGTFAEATAELEPGSTLVLYTDGLVERRDAGLDEGFRLLARAAERSGGDLEGLVEGLVDGVGGGGGDDIALLALRLQAHGTTDRTGTAPPSQVHAPPA